jgi:hypothetical protein
LIHWDTAGLHAETHRATGALRRCHIGNIKHQKIVQVVYVEVVCLYCYFTTKTKSCNFAIILIDYEPV